MNIETIWVKLKQYEGDFFKTVRGVEYNYVVYDNYILINDDKRRRVTKASIEKALTIKNPQLKDLDCVGIKRANSYIYGIITDERIRSI